jgi:L-threonylcarbamoyladenylate synthase
LGNGGVVAIPTETVYGLAANALEEKAIISVFETKGRPRFNPLILHVKSFSLQR